MNVKQLLSADNPYSKLITESRGLVNKWDKTGLLEGIKDNSEKTGMAILLENQASQLLSEATATGTSANSEQWAGVALPLVRRVFAELSSKEYVSVQPMNLPSGLVFYLDFKYGTNQPGKPSYVGQSLFGGTGTKLGSTDSAVNGLYGPGRFAYSSNDQVSSSLSAIVTSGSLVDVNFAPELSASVAANTIKKVSVSLGTDADFLAARSFTVSGSGIVDFYPTATTVSGNNVTFIVSGSSPATTGISVTYSVQPIDRTRGDFEDKNTSAGAGTSGLAADVGIPEINLELRSEPIVSKTRKLKAAWTPELAQDMNAYHSIDAEAELTSLLSEYITMEIDLEIIDMLVMAAPEATTDYWSAAVGAEYNPATRAFEQTAVNRTAYTKSSWFQTLGTKLQKVSNTIYQLTLRGGANFLVVSPNIATILESIPGFSANTDGDKNHFAMGVSKVGDLANRFQVWKNPYMVDNVALLGFKGSSFLEAGAVYAPYVPLMQTPLVYDPINLTPRRGVMTRYAKKVLRPEFYGRIIIGDTNQI